MPRWLTITLKTIGFLIAGVLILWLGVAAYVQSHKKQLLENITSQINNEINGSLSIGAMEPALIRGFPGVSVSLKDVVLRDSLWEKHHHDLLNARNVYISIDAFSILMGSPTVKNISVSDGRIYLYTDTSGYSNTSLFRKKPKKSANSGSGKRINKLSFEQVNAVIENAAKHKYYEFAIDDASGKIKYNRAGWTGDAKLNMIVKSLAFNTAKGSFLKDQRFISFFKMRYEFDSGQLKIPSQLFKIGNNDFQIGGNFGIGGKSSTFNFNVAVEEITLKEATNLLSNHISSKISKYQLSNALSAKATISGDFKIKEDPRIEVSWVTKDNAI